jgi:hypothetical protein
MVQLDGFMTGFTTVPNAAGFSTISGTGGFLTTSGVGGSPIVFGIGRLSTTPGIGGSSTTSGTCTGKFFGVVGNFDLGVAEGCTDCSWGNSESPNAPGAIATLGWVGDSLLV